MRVPDAAAERLHALYVDELVHSLMPPVHPMVDTRQTQALIRHARTSGPGQCEAPRRNDLDLVGPAPGAQGVARGLLQAVRNGAQGGPGDDGRLVRPGRRRRHDHLPGRRQRRRQRPGVPPVLVARGARHQVARARQPRRRSGQPRAAARGGGDGSHAGRARRSTAAADARPAAAGASRLGRHPRACAPAGVAEQEPAHQRERTSGGCTTSL